MKIRLASDLQIDSIVDGEGIRTVIWTQGCPHNCFGCQNPQTHDFKGGFSLEMKEVFKEIDKLQGQTGITFSGGDPFFQSKECSEIAKYAKSKNLNVWCYTGYNYEDILKNNTQKEFLETIDVLIDGKFILEEFSLNLYYRGSRNQRIIDVTKSLKENEIVLINKYMIEKNYIPKVKKEENVYI